MRARWKTSSIHRFNEVVHDVESGRMRIKLGPIFTLDQIAEAHRCMEENQALGKLVIVTK